MSRLLTRPQGLGPGSKIGDATYRVRDRLTGPEPNPRPRLVKWTGKSRDGEDTRFPFTLTLGATGTGPPGASLTHLPFKGSVPLIPRLSSPYSSLSLSLGFFPVGSCGPPVFPRVGTPSTLPKDLLLSHVDPILLPVSPALPPRRGPRSSRRELRTYES